MHDYNSENTERLDVEAVKTKLLNLDYVQNELSDHMPASIIKGPHTTPAAARA